MITKEKLYISEVQYSETNRAVLPLSPSKMDTEPDVKTKQKRRTVQPQLYTLEHKKLLTEFYDTHIESHPECSERLVDIYNTFTSFYTQKKRDLKSRCIVKKTRF